jgi:hypothetical protein
MNRSESANAHIAQIHEQCLETETAARNVCDRGCARYRASLRSVKSGDFQYHHARSQVHRFWTEIPAA